MVKNGFSLASYSSLASFFLFMESSLKGQAVYEDIEPDLLIQSVELDMDNDGSLDFIFFKTEWTYSTVSSDSFYREAIWAHPSGAGLNSIAGNMVTYGEGYVETYWVVDLASSQSIDEDLTFYNAETQKIALKNLRVGSTIWHQRPASWGNDTLDHFVGVKFIDSDECFHYGWIRCAIVDGADLIMKDYAFETKCGVGILAGDTIGDTITVAIEEVNSLNGTIYSFDNIIYINLNELLIGVQIRIYNLNGEKVYYEEIKNQSNKIELNVSKGIYFVELVDGENKIIKKICLN